MDLKQKQWKQEALQAAPSSPGPMCDAQGRIETVVVRGSASSPAERIPVPEGSSKVRAGMTHLRQTSPPDAVDDWYVIEQ